MYWLFTLLSCLLFLVTPQTTSEPIITLQIEQMEDGGHHFHGGIWRPDGQAVALWSDFLFLVIDATTGEIITRADGIGIDFENQVSWTNNDELVVRNVHQLNFETGAWNEIEGVPNDAALYRPPFIGMSNETGDVDIFYYDMLLTRVSGVSTIDNMGFYSDSGSRSPDGNKLVLEHELGFVLIDLVTSTVLIEETYQSSGFIGGCVSSFPTFTWRSDSQVLAVSGIGRPARLYDAQNGPLIRELNSTGNLTWKDDGSQFAVVGENPAVYDGQTFESRFALQSRGTVPFYTSDGSRLVVRGPGSSGYRVRSQPTDTHIYDTTTGNLLLTIPHEGLDNLLCSYANKPPLLSPDGTRLLTWFVEDAPMASGTAARVYVEDDGLKLRAGPGTEYDILTTLPSGTVVDVTGEVFDDGTYRWWPITSPEGIEGYSVEGADGITTLRSLSEVTVINVWNMP